MQGFYPILRKKACTSMIKYTPAKERTLQLFRTPFENTLNPDNRWVRMASLVPWDDLAKVFFRHMNATHGRASVDLRIVLGALLVKHIEGISDEDTIDYIQENIYAQYFVGLSSFQVEPVFVPSLFVEIRKRLGKTGIVELNDLLLQHARDLQAIKHRSKRSVKSKANDRNDPPDTNANTATEKPEEQVATSESKPILLNRGTLKLDATVAPQHIGYPTDTRLLHQARQYAEELIDKLYYKTGLWNKKPRTYRKEARQAYLDFAKKKKASKSDIRKAKRKQLNYLKRDLGHINKMLDQLAEVGIDCPWEKQDWKRLWVLNEFYRQQQLMFDDRRRKVDDRIVNIAQPYVRPIKRGKAGASTEFGAKINVSETEGFCRVDKMDFNNFNEGIGLKAQVEAYKALYGYYPEAVLVDRIYLNRENRKWLKDNNIDHFGPPLGRKPQMSQYEKQKRRKKQNKRSHIEGKFGQAKSKYGLDDIQMKRSDTSFVCIGMIFLAINVIKLAKELWFLFFNSYNHTIKRMSRPFGVFNFDQSLRMLLLVDTQFESKPHLVGERTTF